MSGGGRLGIGDDVDALWPFDFSVINENATAIEDFRSLWNVPKSQISSILVGATALFIEDQPFLAPEFWEFTVTTLCPAALPALYKLGLLFLLDKILTVVCIFYKKKCLYSTLFFLSSLFFVF